MRRIILAFDLYGTLLSTSSISDALAKFCGSEKADTIATVWRKYQLEYTWRLSSMNVGPALDQLKGMPDIEWVVFSNGTKRMIENSMRGSRGLAACSSIFSKVISVDHVMSFKPAPAAYRHLGHCVDPDGENDTWLISSNPFDVVGARVAGIKAIWVDRSGNGWQDRLGSEPSLIVRSLEELHDAINKK